MMRKMLVAFGLAFGVVLCLQGTVPAQTPGTLKWKVYTDNVVECSAALGPDGDIYFGNGDGIYALKPNGDKKWLYDLPKSGGSPAIGVDGTVYAPCNDNYFYALTPQGDCKWSYKFNGFGNSTPGIGPDGTIYVGSVDKKLYAFRPDGTLKWTYTADGGIGGSLAIGPDGTIYFWDYGALYAVKPDGTHGWKFANGGCPALGADGTIYFAYYNAFYALNPDGSVKWEERLPIPLTDQALRSAPAIGPDGSLYFCMVNPSNNELKVFALDATGKKKWEYLTGTDSQHYGMNTPAVGANGLIYVANGAGKLCAIRPDGKEEWSLQVTTGTFSAPLLGPDGTIYLGSSGDRYFYAVYSSSLGLAKSPWPMYHRDVRHTACMPAAAMQGLTAILPLLLLK